MIRLAVENDLNDILEIYNDAIINTTAVYSYQAQSLEERRIWLNKKTEEGYPVFVYEEDRRILGFSTYGPFRAWPAYKYTIEHSVYVKSDCRSRGIGSALVKELINYADYKGYATIVAGIDASNEKSIKLHQNLEFEYSGTIRRVGYKFGKWLDLSFYQLDLKGPSIQIED
jgi:phosphinothricin acetyltransferase